MNRIFATDATPHMPFFFLRVLANVTVIWMNVAATGGMLFGLDESLRLSELSTSGK